MWPVVDQVGGRGRPLFTSAGCKLLREGGLTEPTGLWGRPFRAELSRGCVEGTPKSETRMEGGREGGRVGGGERRREGEREGGKKRGKE